MVWLGNKRGFLFDAITQDWVRLTGTRFDPKACPWLNGPVGDAQRIGSDFFERLAASQGLGVREAGGLLNNFDSLFSDPLASAGLNEDVAHFYEHTAHYTIDAWSEWAGAFRPFGHALAILFSRRLQQLNVPLRSLETSRGMTSRLIEIVDSNGRSNSVAWIRTLRSTGRVVYCGTYSTCKVPGYEGRCLKVAFPLPNGNATVILRPAVGKDGSLRLTSNGHRFGDPGFYFILFRDGRYFARYVRAMREMIHVYPGDDETIRADHELRFFGATFLRLHYKLAQSTRMVAAGDRI